MNLKKQNKDDIQFILSEIMRFREMSTNELISLSDIDALNMIRNHNNDNIIMGAKANKRFYALSNRHLKINNGLNERITEQDFTEVLKKSFVEFFLTPPGREVNDQNIDRMFSSAEKKVKKASSNAIHYFPCNLFLQKELSEFSVGPVKFYQTEVFKEKFHNEIVRSITKNDGQYRNYNIIKAIFPKLTNKPEKVIERFLDRRAKKDNLSLIKQFEGS